MFARAQPARRQLLCALLLQALLAHCDAAPLPRTGWTAVASSAEDDAASSSSALDGAAANVLDGDEETIWHSEWSPDDEPLPHTITITMGDEPLEVAGLTYLPRQDGSSNGRIGALKHDDKCEECAAFPG